MKYRHLLLPLLSVSLLSAPDFVLAQGIPSPNVTPPASVPQKAEKLQDFAFEGADLDTVMTMYSEWTGKIYLKTDAVKATITLKANKLTTSESIEVVEAILAMNNIAIVPMGAKYIKVVAANDTTGQGLQINMDPEKEFGGTDKFITTIVQLNNVTTTEVQAAIQHVLHSYGKILALTRSNSIMITDTEANVKRAKELIEFIDQATAQVESRIYQIQYAEASDIASKLTEIVTAAQADQKTTTAPATRSATRTAYSGIRAARSTTAPTQAAISQATGESTPIIHGTVKIMSDERTNIIIIFSVEENFEFFDQIIKVLDVEVEPATTFEVVHLEYADATELSGTLNDLIGAASSSRSSSSSSRSSSSRTSPSSRNESSSSRVTPNASPAGALASAENLSRLSEDTKILADERSNAIILMGSKADIAVIKTVIAGLDIMLEQVIIEAAVFEVTLDDNLNHGISWFYNRNNSRVGGWDASNLSSGTNAFGIVANALSYYRTFPDINITAAVNLSKEDDNVRLLQNPIITTTDNTEASITIGEQKPVVTSTSTYNNSAGTTSSNYEYKDIGIQLTVTPRINPQGYVVMEVSQKADQLGPDVTIDDNAVPTVFNREFEATIAVPNKSTVVLGGMVRHLTSDEVDKIPILGDIPLIGRYLFSNVTKENEARELIVLMTPTVLASIEDSEREVERLYRSTDLTPADWPQDWSSSKLRLIPDEVEPAEEGQRTTPTKIDAEQLLEQMSNQ